MDMGKAVKSRMTRMRTKPRFFDYCYFANRSNLNVLNTLKGLVSKEDTIVDIGCGSKPFQNFFTCKSYLGLDFNPVDATVLCHDLNDPLPFADNSQTHIILSEVLEHVPEPYRVLDEVHRVLKSDGIIFMSTPFAIPVHGAPYDFFRFTYLFYENLEQKYGWELNTFKASNAALSSPFQVANQLALGLPLPFWSKYPFWIVSNLASLALEALVKILPAGLRRKLTLAFPMGYAAILKVKK